MIDAPPRQSAFRSHVTPELAVSRRVGPIQPMHALGCAADAGIEHVARIQLLVVLNQRRLGVIKMADIVLGRIFGPALVEQRPHALFECHAVMPFRHDVILVKDVAEKMTIIELVDDRRLDVGRQGLEPMLIVSPQRDIERQNVLNLAIMDGAIAIGRTRGRKT